MLQLFLLSITNLGITPNKPINFVIINKKLKYSFK